MAPAQSKIASQQMFTNSDLLQNVFESMFKNNNRKIVAFAAIGVIGLLVKLRLQNNYNSPSPRTKKKIQQKNNKQRQGQVTKEFWENLLRLIKIVIPRWSHPSVFTIIALTFLLWLRTQLSIYISGAIGRIVKALVDRKFGLYITRILQLGLLAVPSSFVNSLLEFLNKQLSIYFRTELSTYFNKIYLKDMIFYQITNLDSRVSNPDQHLTSNIEKWASSLSMIYSNFTKPVLDIVLFSQKLAQLVGVFGPLILVIWYLFSGLVLKIVSPSFGQYTAVQQLYEGDYRACHSALVTHAEEIAFYRGHKWEKKRMEEKFDNLMKHSEVVQVLKLFMGVFDGMLTKYGATMAGYAILGLPVFGPGQEQYLKSVQSDPSKITRDYVRNSSLLINLAKAIGRLVMSYKEIQHLAGYTSLVAQMDQVLHNLEAGIYKRRVVHDKDMDDISPQGKSPKSNIKDLSSHFDDSELQTLSLKGGRIESSDNFIEFINVPIKTPNNDILIQSFNLKIERGQNVVISGPNGCGKSSMFRILGNLWPIQENGTLRRPDLNKLFYIPQRPYLPAGTLRDQIIYPDSQQEMIQKKHTDDDLKKLLNISKLNNIVKEDEGGFNQVRHWNDYLSGGEKQRIAMARLFYHKPQFAILDECTSQVELDVEADLYKTCKDMNITLFTVSHRTSAFKYHEFKLKFDGQGNYELQKMDAQE